MSDNKTGGTGDDIEEEDLDVIDEADNEPDIEEMQQGGAPVNNAQQDTDTPDKARQDQIDDDKKKDDDRLKKEREEDEDDGEKEKDSTVRKGVNPLAMTNQELIAFILGMSVLFGPLVAGACLVGYAAMGAEASRSAQSAKKALEAREKDRDILNNFKEGKPLLPDGASEKEVKNAQKVVDGLLKDMPASAAGRILEERTQNIEKSKKLSPEQKVELHEETLAVKDKWINSALEKRRYSNGEYISKDAYNQSVNAVKANARVNREITKAVDGVKNLSNEAKFHLANTTGPKLDDMKPHGLFSKANVGKTFGVKGAEKLADIDRRAYGEDAKAYNEASNCVQTAVKEGKMKPKELAEYQAKLDTERRQEHVNYTAQKMIEEGRDFNAETFAQDNKEFLEQCSKEDFETMIENYKLNANVGRGVGDRLSKSDIDQNIHKMATEYSKHRSEYLGKQMLEGKSVDKDFMMLNSPKYLENAIEARAQRRLQTEPNNIKDIVEQESQARKNLFMMPLQGGITMSQKARDKAINSSNLQNGIHPHIGINEYLRKNDLDPNLVFSPDLMKEDLNQSQVSNLTLARQELVKRAVFSAIDANGALHPDQLSAKMQTLRAMGMPADTIQTYAKNASHGMTKEATEAIQKSTDGLTDVAIVNNACNQDKCREVFNGMATDQVYLVSEMMREKVQESKISETDKKTALENIQKAQKEALQALSGPTLGQTTNHVVNNLAHSASAPAPQSQEQGNEQQPQQSQTPVVKVGQIARNGNGDLTIKVNGTDVTLADLKKTPLESPAKDLIDGLHNYPDAKKAFDEKLNNATKSSFIENLFNDNDGNKKSNEEQGKELRDIIEKKVKDPGYQEITIDALSGVTIKFGDKTLTLDDLQDKNNKDAQAFVEYLSTHSEQEKSFMEDLGERADKGTFDKIVEALEALANLLGIKTTREQAQGLKDLLTEQVREKKQEQLQSMTMEQTPASLIIKAMGAEEFIKTPTNLTEDNVGNLLDDNFDAIVDTLQKNSHFVQAIETGIEFAEKFGIMSAEQAKGAKEMINNLGDPNLPPEDKAKYKEQFKEVMGPVLLGAAFMSQTEAQKGQEKQQEGDKENTPADKVAGFLKEIGLEKEAGMLMQSPMNQLFNGVVKALKLEKLIDSLSKMQENTQGKEGGLDLNEQGLREIGNSAIKALQGSKVLQALVTKGIDMMFGKDDPIGKMLKDVVKQIGEGKITSMDNLFPQQNAQGQDKDKDANQQQQGDKENTPADKIADMLEQSESSMLQAVGGLLKKSPFKEIFNAIVNALGIKDGMSQDHGMGQVQGLSEEQMKEIGQKVIDVLKESTVLRALVKHGANMMFGKDNEIAKGICGIVDDIGNGKINDSNQLFATVKDKFFLGQENDQNKNQQQNQTQGQTPVAGEKPVENENNPQEKTTLDQANEEKVDYSLFQLFDDKKPVEHKTNQQQETQSVQENDKDKTIADLTKQLAKAHQEINSLKEQGKEQSVQDQKVENNVVPVENKVEPVVEQVNTESKAQTTEQEKETEQVVEQPDPHQVQAPTEVQGQEKSNVDKAMDDLNNIANATAKPNSIGNNLNEQKKKEGIEVEISSPNDLHAVLQECAKNYSGQLKNRGSENAEKDKQVMQDLITKVDEAKQRNTGRITVTEKHIEVMNEFTTKQTSYYNKVKENVRNNDMSKRMEKTTNTGSLNM